MVAIGDKYSGTFLKDMLEKLVVNSLSSGSSEAPLWMDITILQNMQMLLICLIVIPRILPLVHLRWILSHVTSHEWGRWIQILERQHTVRWLCDLLNLVGLFFNANIWLYSPRIWNRVPTHLLNFWLHLGAWLIDFQASCWVAPPSFRQVKIPQREIDTP